MTQRSTVAFCYFMGCDPQPNVSAWGHLGSAGVEWGRNGGEGVGWAKLRALRRLPKIGGLKRQGVSQANQDNNDKNADKNSTEST
jgi:hypothetical protein